MIKIFNSSPIDFVTKDIVRSEKTGDSLKALRDELSAIEIGIEEYEREIGDAFEEMEADHSVLASELPPVQADIARLKVDIQRYVPTPEVKPEIPVEKDSQSPKKLCKELYSLIAVECHPDKTSDPSKHEIFKQAQEAFETLDYNSLWILVSAVSKGTFESDSLIDEQVEVLKRLILEKSMILSNMENSVQLKIARNYYSLEPLKKLDANQKFVNIIYNKIKDLLSEKEGLEKKLYDLKS